MAVKLICGCRVVAWLWRGCGVVVEVWRGFRVVAWL